MKLVWGRTEKNNSWGSGCIQKHFRPTFLGRVTRAAALKSLEAARGAGSEPHAARLTARYVAPQGREWRQTLLESLGGPGCTDIFITMNQNLGFLAGTSTGKA